MIAQLTGILIEKSPTEVVVDVHGVGYLVSIPLSTYETLEHQNGEVTLLTHLHVREDVLQLYGFATEAERSLFRMLISISGIGPKMAQGILSGLNPAEFREAITTGNLLVLTSISGVGRKTAERLIIELKDKIAKGEGPEDAAVFPATSQQGKIRAEAIVALMSLGYTRQNAEKALRAVLNETTEREFTIEELIKQSLRHATRG